MTATSNGGTHEFKGAGGHFGLSSDWRLGVQEGGDLRGEACMATDKREQMLEILEKRKMTPSRKKVLQAFESIHSRTNVDIQDHPTFN